MPMIQGKEGVLARWWTGIFSTATDRELGGNRICGADTEKPYFRMRRMDTPLRCLPQRILLYRLLPRDKYLQGQKVIGFIAIGFDLPQSDQIEIEMEGQWKSPATACSSRWENFMEIVPRNEGGDLRLPLLRFCKGCGAKSCRGHLQRIWP